MTTPQLLPPSINEGITVKQALSRRHPSRQFSSEPLSIKNLSEVLWAAYGVNRPDTGKRTAPSACGVYPLELYVALPQGIYLYEPKTQTLTPVVEGDHRAELGTQDFVATAPCNIIVVSNYNRFHTGDDELDALMKGHEASLSALDAGAVTENVYLYCTCAGINVVERASADEDTIKATLGLGQQHHFVVAMTLGYPPVPPAPHFS